MEVETKENRIILDAGTGIRALGEKLNSDPGIEGATVFLSHFHWDHIQGFPFFAPAYKPGFRLKIVGPEQPDSDVESLLKAQMGSAYFPIPYSALSADLSFHHFNEGTWEEEGFILQALRVRHTSFAVGYRVEAFGISVVYIPDNELRGGDYAIGPAWGEDLLAFVSEADLLIHDATFTEEEYPSREGWGHSTFQQAVDLARQARVKSLHFFHHAPGRSDGELDEIVQRIRTLASQEEWDLDVHAAIEGEPILLGRG